MSTIQLNIEELQDILIEVKKLRWEIESLKSQIKKNDELVVAYKLNERIRKDVAAKYIGCSQKKLDDYIDDGLLPKPDKWNRFLVNDIINLKKFIEETYIAQFDNLIPDEAI